MKAEKKLTNFAATLRSLLAQRGWRPVDIVKRSKLKDSQISMISNGRNVSDDVFSQIEHAFKGSHLEQDLLRQAWLKDISERAPNPNNSVKIIVGRLEKEITDEEADLLARIKALPEDQIQALSMVLYKGGDEFWNMVKIYAEHYGRNCQSAE